MDDWKHDIYVKMLQGDEDPFTGCPEQLSTSKKKNLKTESKGYAIVEGYLCKKVVKKLKEPIFIRENIEPTKTYADLRLGEDFNYIDVDKIEYYRIVK